MACHHFVPHNAFDDFNIAFQNYTVTIPFECALQPSTVLMDNFTIQGRTTEQQTNVTEVVYLPQSKTAILSVRSCDLKEVNCQTMISDELSYLDSTQEISSVLDSVFIRSYACEAFSMSVKSVEIIQNGVSVLHPLASETFDIHVKVINTSDVEQTGKLTLYLNENIDTPIISEEISVKENSENDLIYSFSGIDRWNVRDVLKAILL